MQSYPPTSTCVELPLYGDSPIYMFIWKREDGEGLSWAPHPGEKAPGPAAPSQCCAMAEAKGHQGS